MVQPEHLCEDRKILEHQQPLCLLRYDSYNISHVCSASRGLSLSLSLSICACVLCITACPRLVFRDFLIHVPRAPKKNVYFRLHRPPTMSPLPTP